MSISEVNLEFERQSLIITSGGREFSDGLNLGAMGSPVVPLAILFAPIDWAPVRGRRNQPKHTAAVKKRR